MLAEAGNAELTRVSQYLLALQEQSGRATAAVEPLPLQQPRSPP